MVPIDGLAGLAPEDPLNPLPFVSSLYNAGLIEKKMFGFIFGKGGFPSQITFGGYDEAKKLSPNEPIYWYPITNSSRWQIDL
jgi:hypothetical protein